MEINKAIEKILLHFPMLGYFIFGWEDIKQDNTVPTLATNYKSLKYNENFVKKLSPAELGGVILHEIIHCLFLHPTELGRAIERGKNRFLWTLALEQVTNDEVLKITLKTPFILPGGAISPLDITGNESDHNQTGYIYSRALSGKSALEVYQELLKHYGYDSTGVLCLSNYLADDITENVDDEQAQEATQKTIAAILGMRAAGKGTTGCERLLKELEKSRVPFARILSSFTSQAIAAGANDISWTRRDNRHPLADEIFMPGLIDVEIPEPIVVIDTSGSITKENLAEFAAGIAAIKSLTEKVVVMTTDVRVHEKVSISSVSQILEKIKFKGGGGTDFNAVFKEVKECSFMVFFTDGVATYPKEKPKYPVLWVLTQEGQTPPFGKVAYTL